MCYCTPSDEEAERRQSARDWGHDHNEDPDARLYDDFERERHEPSPFTGTSGFEAEEGPDPRDEQGADK